jgi:sec-independent protein translocase protein TatB
MLFDIAWPELMLIGVIALIVIGPKDLPAALRVAGVWMRKARMLSREFQSSVEQMIRDAELDDMRQQLKKATDFDLNQEFQKTVDPTGELAQSIKPPEIPDFFEAPPLPMPELAHTDASVTASSEIATAEPEVAALPPPSEEEPMLPGFELLPVIAPVPLHEPSPERSAEPSRP